MLCGSQNLKVLSTHPRHSRLRLLIIILTIEKLFQHGLTAIMFLDVVPGLCPPDIGTRFQIDGPSMAMLNLGYFGLMVFGLFGFMRDRPWGWVLVFWMALLDIVLEFWFHHWFFITVSVIVSTALAVLIRRYRSIERQEKLSVQSDR